MSTQTDQPDTSKMLIEALFNGTLDDIVDIAEEIMGNPIYIRDNSHKVLAISSTRFPDCKFLSDLQENRYLNRETIAGIKKNRRLYADDGPGSKPKLINFDPALPDLLTTSIFINNVVAGYVSVIQINHDFTEADYDALTLISKALSVELQKNDIYSTNIGLMHETFLNSLLAHDMDSPRSRSIVDRQISSLNLNLKPCLFLSVYKFTTKDRQHSNQIRMIANELHHVLPGSITCVQSDIIVSLSSNDTDRPFSDEIEHSMERFLQYYDLCCVFSSAYQDICHSYRQFTMLRQVLDIGRRLYPKKRIQHLQDLLVYQMFMVCNRTAPLIEFVPPRMMKLRDYDRQNNSELFTTLYYYLICQKNTSAVAAKLNIHRNTLFYRINRIHEITEFDLNNEETVFQILLSFKLLEYSALETGRKLCFKLESDQ